MTKYVYVEFITSDLTYIGGVYHSIKKWKKNRDERWNGKCKWITVIEKDPYFQYKMILDCPLVGITTQIITLEKRKIK